MVDIDATGGLATGGLIATAIEKPTGKAGEPHTGTCSDCGETVTGNYCANCGQPTHVHRSLLHLGEEFLHGILHFDARVWRTLPLLALNPGKLTREWIQGKRTRYVSPLGLFLFTVFLMFFLMSFGGSDVVKVQPLPERIAAVRTDIEAGRTSVADALVALTAAQTAASSADADDAEVAGATLETAQEAFAEAVDDLADRSDDLARLERQLVAGPRADGLTPGSWQAELADATKSGDVTVNAGSEGIDKKILKKLANPDLALYKIQQTLYKFAFLLVPFSIPFVWLLFAWKRGFTWYDHGVFVLYSLTFMAILAMLVIPLAQLEASADGGGAVTSTVGTLVTFGMPVHMFAQLKGTYGLSWFSALWRTFALMIFCSIVLSLFLVAIVLLGLGT